MPRSIITLTTDFGASSPYIAQMKGVILGIHDDVELVDISHAIGPQQILAGAATLADVYRYFPPGSIHIAVVDPGVGTERGIVLAEIEGHFFVAPDNGLLSLVARRVSPTRIVRLEASEYWNPRISSTFHGRDIMAPVAAHLARGVDFARFGPSQPVLQTLEVPLAVVGERSAEAAVLTIDTFGNVSTNLDGELLPADISQLTLRIDDQPPRVLPVVRAYAQRPPSELVVLIGSNGRLELAVVDGNAAARLGVKPGSGIRLSW